MIIFVEVGVLVWMTLCTSFMTFLASILLITGVFKVTLILDYYNKDYESLITTKIKRN